MGGNLMALEDDQLAAMQALIAKSQAAQPFMGRVVSADPDPLQVVVEGTSVALPAQAFTTDALTVGLQVAVLPVVGKYIVLGALGTYVPVTPPVVVDTELTTVLTADTTYGTANTSIMTLALTVGTWAIDLAFGHEWVGATDQIGQLTFGGTQTLAQFEWTRMTVSAIASGFGVALATDMNFGQPAGLTQRVHLKGGMVVTADGTLTFTMRRVAGTSAKVRQAATITATRV